MSFIWGSNGKQKKEDYESGRGVERGSSSRHVPIQKGEILSDQDGDDNQFNFNQPPILQERAASFKVNGYPSTDWDDDHQYVIHFSMVYNRRQGKATELAKSKLGCNGCQNNGEDGAFPKHLSAMAISLRNGNEMASANGGCKIHETLLAMAACRSLINR